VQRDKSKRELSYLAHNDASAKVISHAQDAGRRTRERGMRIANAKLDVVKVHVWFSASNFGPVLRLDSSCALREN